MKAGDVTSSILYIKFTKWIDYFLAFKIFKTNQIPPYKGGFCTCFEKIFKWQTSDYMHIGNVQKFF